MPCGIYQITDIPASELGGVMVDAHIGNPTDVKSVLQPDGNYTVIITYPPCAETKTFDEHIAATDT
ncbi:hypothetical protein P6144_03340 [Sphingomonas sp. HITSZ_GF]|uniref:hypothetical protein n=1 Tax=Sphingomonas sp. HITSZ_GF TaxID=3037247 RepID=UPI00240D17E8|nr:hypothetical protein [Sphingomonas sp. HITSZ_GF]MDG2532668.1 hypothetical protein [Sphingomonas sp. HITSZ_GF]